MTNTNVAYTPTWLKDAPISANGATVGVSSANTGNAPLTYVPSLGAGGIFTYIVMGIVLLIILYFFFIKK